LIGFLHRSLQEYFAGSYLAQLSLADRRAFINAHAAHAVWKEPILYLLFLIRNEQEVGVLVDAIDQAAAGDPAEEAVRTALLTEAAFADFAHDIPKAQRLVQRFFEEVELHAWGPRQRELLGTAVGGLFSQSVSGQCAERLAEWIPDYHGYGRQRAILAMRKWDTALRPACVPLLIRVVAGDLEPAWRAAGVVLAEFARDMLDALVIADPSHRLVEPLLRELVAEKWSLDDLFGRSNIPLERVTWTAGFDPGVERPVHLGVIFAPNLGQATRRPKVRPWPAFMDAIMRSFRDGSFNTLLIQ
jgi:hypothetical protein